MEGLSYTGSLVEAAKSGDPGSMAVLLDWLEESRDPRHREVIREYGWMILGVEQVQHVYEEASSDRPLSVIAMNERTRRAAVRTQAYYKQLADKLDQLFWQELSPAGIAARLLGVAQIRDRFQTMHAALPKSSRSTQEYSTPEFDGPESEDMESEDLGSDGEGDVDMTPDGAIPATGSMLASLAAEFTAASYQPPFH